MIFCNQSICDVKVSVAYVDAGCGRRRTGASHGRLRTIGASRMLSYIQTYTESRFFDATTRTDSAMRSREDGHDWREIAFDFSPVSCQSWPSLKIVALASANFLVRCFLSFNSFRPRAPRSPLQGRVGRCGDTPKK
jgi:hypothetical protein